MVAAFICPLPFSSDLSQNSFHRDVSSSYLRYSMPTNTIETRKPRYPLTEYAWNYWATPGCEHKPVTTHVEETQGHACASTSSFRKYEALPTSILLKFSVDGAASESTHSLMKTCFCEPLTEYPIGLSPFHYQFNASPCAAYRCGAPWSK